MTRLDARNEPSMEDILASIRKIIAEDGSQAPPLSPQLPESTANGSKSADRSTNGEASAFSQSDASHATWDQSADSLNGHHDAGDSAQAQHEQEAADETAAHARVPGPERPGFTVMRDGFLPEHGESEAPTENEISNELGAGADEVTNDSEPSEKAALSFDLGPSPFAKTKESETTEEHADMTGLHRDDVQADDSDLSKSEDLESLIDDTIDDAFGSEEHEFAAEASDHEPAALENQDNAAESDDVFNVGSDRIESGTDDSHVASSFSDRAQASTASAFESSHESPETDSMRSPDRANFGFPSGDTAAYNRSSSYSASQARSSELGAGEEDEASFTSVRSTARDVLNVAEPEPPRARGERHTGYADAVTEHISSFEEVSSQHAQSAPAAHLYDRKSESEAGQSNFGIEDAFEAVAATLDDEPDHQDDEARKNALTVSDPDQRAIEDTVADLLRPMLKSWLAENMPKIVERALRREINELKLGVSRDD